MEEKKNLLTYAGLKKLEEELHDLKVVKRKEVAEKGRLILGYSQFLYYTKKHPDCQAFRAPLLLFIFLISHGFNFYANLDKSASRAS